MAVSEEISTGSTHEERASDQNSISAEEWGEEKAQLHRSQSLPQAVILGRRCFGVLPNSFLLLLVRHLLLVASCYYS